ncbi:AMP-binding protein [Methylocystis parvus]|uniref:AMP-binding protein n=1 Tax=Methylocystis parvus TaxID=134 RepID=UPI001FCA8DD4|nr:class I adenylate-forming enzyme family protein [Methylocystis parvus]WBJ98646.1 acyl--CoA ligase [Methylocystis parvus OBBP]
MRILARNRSLQRNELIGSTIIAERRNELAGKCVLISVREQIDCARALIELDGCAARLVILPPDFAEEQFESVLTQAEVDAVVADEPNPRGARRAYRVGEAAHAPPGRGEPVATEWVLPTSGTTGSPKLVAHGLEQLLGSVPLQGDVSPPVWATFYDIRRFGGLQIFLRACAAGTALTLLDPNESLGEYVQRCRENSVTHISGTPSHWRRLLMSPHARDFSPEAIRLSGEIADRAILDALRVTYPEAKITHAYASTEAGVGFEVCDGREGFPATYLESDGCVEMRLEDGTLRIRSPRVAVRYVGRPDLELKNDEGFVDTDDIVERIGDRCFFRGRRAGVINVGGLKVHPEEIEEIINMHPRVHMSRVSARISPITGNLTTAEVVLDDAGAQQDSGALRAEILELCHSRLAHHKAPATITFVRDLGILASGKMERRHA